MAATADFDSSAARLRGRIDQGAGKRLIVTEGPLPLLAPRLPGRLRAAFSTRLGGLSRPPYDSLDLGEHTGDRPEDVRENRSRLRAALPDSGGVESDLELVLPRQEHTTRVVGAAEWARAPRGACDGLTVQSGLDEGFAAAVLVADCLPVLLVSDSDMAVVHAGWRGLLAGILQEAARAMTAPPGIAVLGPAIGVCCYEVGGDLAEAFARRYGSGLFGEGRLDLKESARRALAEVGVPAGRVVDPGLCTSCNPDLFYSHRRDGRATGRQALVAWLAPERGEPSATRASRARGRWQES